MFITGPQPKRDESGELGIGYGASAVWFTDGSAPVRIGTTAGSAVRGFGIATSVSGSTLAWKEPGDETTETLQSALGPVVVYDTARMREVGRFGGTDAYPLGPVYDDVVYWAPDGRSCDVTSFGFGPATSCRRTAQIMRLDMASGRQSSVQLGRLPGGPAGPARRADRAVRRDPSSAAAALLSASCDAVTTSSPTVAIPERSSPRPWL